MIHHEIKNQLLHGIIQALDNGDELEFQNIIKELHPYDFAQLYEHLSTQYRNEFLNFLYDDELAKLIQALAREEQVAVLDKIGMKKTANVIERMDNDNLVSLLTDLEPVMVADILTGMDKDDAVVIQNLMTYPPETAGRIMNNQMVWINKSSTVRDAVDKLKDFAELAEYLNYLYVIDYDKKLVGVVSYRDLLLADMYDKIEYIMNKRVVNVDAFTDQEEVAKLMQRYNFVTMPVIRADHTLAGIVTIDDILDVVYQEANEDIEKLSASGKEIGLNTRPSVAAYRRLTWLILLLFIGIVSASIIAGFEDTLDQMVALAFFMPMIAGMTGNTGTQSLAIVVRGLTTNDLGWKQVTKLIIRELWVGIIIGVTCGILIFLIAFIWQGSAALGFVIGFSLFCTLIIGTLAGTVIPLILYRMNIDPAVASGPLITTINDILSLFIYFGIATLFLSQLM